LNVFQPGKIGLRYECLSSCAQPIKLLCQAFEPVHTAGGKDYLRSCACELAGSSLTYTRRSASNNNDFTSNVHEFLLYLNNKMLTPNLIMQAVIMNACHPSLYYGPHLG
jgi:hypothetical protein